MSDEKKADEKSTTTVDGKMTIVSDAAALAPSDPLATPPTPATPQRAAQSVALAISPATPAQPVVLAPPTPPPATPVPTPARFAFLTDNRRKWLAWVMIAVVSTLVTRYLGISTPIPPVPDVPIFATGWQPDPEAVKATLDTLPTPYFEDTPANQVKLGDDDALLWKSYEKLYGKPFPTRSQGQVGSCVSFGWAAVIEVLQAIQIATWDAAKRGPPPDYKDIAQEVIYGGSRVEVGGGRINGDGSVGAWAAKFVTEYGILPRGKYEVGGKTYDLSAYSESTCRLFGRSGVPDVLEPQVKLTPVKTVTLVRNAAEAKKALQQGYPIAVCSDQGFSSTRDADGVSRASGSWGHCMAILGYAKVGSKKRPCFLFMNSWGKTWNRGGKGEHDIPDGSFWAEESVVDRMLRQGDSFAASDVVGFPSRKIDWFVRGNGFDGPGEFDIDRHDNRRLLTVNVRKPEGAAK